MKRGELESLLRAACPDATEAEDQCWKLTVSGVPMMCFSNESKDRMRLIASVAFLADVADDRLPQLLRANFNGDACYAIHEDLLCAVFLHSLSGLTETDLLSGLRQVAERVQSFGTSYSSGTMRFQWPRPMPDAPGGVRRRTVEAVQRSLRRPDHEE